MNSSLIRFVAGSGHNITQNLSSSRGLSLGMNESALNQSSVDQTVGSDQQTGIILLVALVSVPILIFSGLEILRRSTPRRIEPYIGQSGLNMDSMDTFNFSQVLPESEQIVNS